MNKEDIVQQNNKISVGYFTVGVVSEFHQIWCYMMSFPSRHFSIMSDQRPILTQSAFMMRSMKAIDMHALEATIVDLSFHTWQHCWKPRTIGSIVSAASASESRSLLVPLKQCGIHLKWILTWNLFAHRFSFDHL